VDEEIEGLQRVTVAAQPEDAFISFVPGLTVPIIICSFTGRAHNNSAMLSPPPKESAMKIKFPAGLLIMACLLFAEPGFCAKEYHSKVTILNGTYTNDRHTDINPSRTSCPCTNFCLKRLLNVKGGNLYCNWTISLDAACVQTSYSRYIKGGTITSGPTKVGSCVDGNEIVKVVNN
jgi:hypothetical protein